MSKAARTIERMQGIREMPVEALREHPMATLVPEMRPDEWEEFYRDIAFSGIKIPLEVQGDGTVLDGRHRLRAAKKLGMQVVPVVDPHLNGDTPEQYIIKSAVLRRHLSDDQRAALAALWAERNSKLGKNQHTKEDLGNVSQTLPTRTESAMAFKVSEEKVKDATYVKRHAPELLEQVRTGDISLTKARRDAKQRVEAEQAKITREPPRPTTKINGWTVIQGDAADPATYDGITADLAIFSPPYNVGKVYAGDPSLDQLPHDEWCQLLTDTSRNLVDLAKVSWICINVPQGLGRRPYMPLVPPVLSALNDLTSMQLDGVIVWDKMTTGNRTSWGSWRKPTAPAIRDRTEAIVVFKTMHEPRVADSAYNANGHSKLVTSKQFTTLTQDIWRIRPEKRELGHPAPFPVELPQSLIRLFGWRGCTVIDPFAGTGTTGIAAHRLKCQAVLIDRSAEYCELAKQRLITKG